MSIHQEDVGVCVLVISLVTLSPVHSHSVDVDAQLAFRRHVQKRFGHQNNSIEENI